MSPIRVLSAADVRAALPMERAIDAMELAFGEYAAGRAQVPLRNRLDTESGILLTMPAHLPQAQISCVKVVSFYGDNPQRGLPAVMGTVLLLDGDTGQPKALLEGDSLTARRTGAAGGLAARLLARPEGRVVALFGAGVQARAQLEALMVVRPIEEVRLVSRTWASAQALAAEIAAGDSKVKPVLCNSPQEAVLGADIVVAATSSATPVFNGADLAPGTHVTGVGSFTAQMQEVDGTTVERARVIVDSRQGCTAEAGDLIAVGAAIDAELGEVVNGTKPGRQSATEITFFKSVGLAAQDAAAAAAVLEGAEAAGLGTVVEL